MSTRAGGPSSRVALWLAVACLLASSAGSAPRFGGPDAVENQLEADESEKQPLLGLDFLRPYLDWKQRLRERTGLHFGGDYSTQAFFASESLGQKQAAGGMLRFFGAWDLLDRDGDHPGAFVWKIEHRHGYTPVAPSSFGFEIGTVGLMGAPFSDQGFRTTNLYWRQRFSGGRFALLAGFLDATDYVDVYALASPWTGFTNLVFSTGGAAIALPNDAMLGIAAAGMITDQLYAIGSLGDANGDPENPFDGFESFFGDFETFKSLELGWTPSQEQLVSDNVHLTFWHVDSRDKAGTPSGWGVNLSASMTLGEHWMPFLRAGWSEDGGALLDGSVSLGLSYQATPGRDLLGLAANWGRPDDDSFGPGLPDQWTFELFYRWQLLQQVAITPSVQLIVDPATNPSESAIWVFGLRLRYAL